MNPFFLDYFFTKYLTANKFKNVTKVTSSLQNITVKRSSTIFENSFLKNGISQLWSEAFRDSIQAYFQNSNKVHKIKILLLQKSLLRIFAKNNENFNSLSWVKFRWLEMFSKSQETSQILNMFHHLRLQIPTAWG